ncbi:adenosylmethionine decarboxylase [Sneathiella glossodoripedis]|uniref:adenosylmethionine decarboxylase n=1 Tax=Sneathiella glossodoripedis TaxID=418853 RepID=UPI00055B9800|nr:adenosylmethionine decarboxylase [Sneathiella glossodoripedis]
MAKVSKITDMDGGKILNETAKPDYFVERDGLVFAGTHLIIDLWDASNLNDADLIEKSLRQCVQAAGATLLHFHIHAFEPNGLSGVVVLAESHITFHSWPDQNYMALDIFMCGKAEPHKCIPILKEAFKPQTIQVNDIKRGVIA